MLILALDLASKTGWATWREGETLPKWGSHRIARVGCPVGEFASAAHGWLAEMLGQIEPFGAVPTKVVFESPWVGPKTSQATARKLMGLACLTDMLCHDADIECYEILVSNIRYYFIGCNPKNAVAKPLTLEECARRGWDCDGDNDAADALALMTAFRASLRGETVPASLTAGAVAPQTQAKP